MTDRDHRDLLAKLTRRQILTRGGTAGLGALVAAALPLAGRLPVARAAAPSTPTLVDATLQAFADTILPGRKVLVTESGQPVSPLAIAGADPLPGAVEADALALYHNAEIGFDAIEMVFVGDVEARSLLRGNQFLNLPFADRVQVCLDGLAASNPTLLVWEAAAAVPFVAFCAAALVVNATWNDACGYRVMGLPGTAPGGYADYSWRRVLSRELTRTGSLP